MYVYSAPTCTCMYLPLSPHTAYHSAPMLLTTQPPCCLPLSPHMYVYIILLIKHSAPPPPPPPTHHLPLLLTNHPPTCISHSLTHPPTGHANSFLLDFARNLACLGVEDQLTPIISTVEAECRRDVCGVEEEYNGMCT